MFITVNSGNIMSISTEKDDVFAQLKSIYDAYHGNYVRQSANQHSYMVRNYGSAEAYASSQLTGIRVYDIGDNFRVGSVYDIGRRKDANIIDLTDEFLDIETTEVIVGYHVTARVVKKGLKSTGKTVVVVNQVQGDKIETPAQIKELYDKMVRINVRVEGWGAMTVSPDSLDEYKRTAQTKQLRVVKLKAKPE